jgi:nucleoside-diphosphate-sugar epimerase
LRYFNVYGPGEMPGLYRNVIPNFFNKAFKKEPLTITGDGNETRDFTYVDDAVGATVKAAYSEKTDGQVINIASGVETKISDLANKINALTDNKEGVVFLKRRGWDNIIRRTADIEKAGRLLGYAPGVNIDEGLSRTYKWLKKNLKTK